MSRKTTSPCGDNDCDRCFHCAIMRTQRILRSFHSWIGGSHDRQARLGTSCPHEMLYRLCPADENRKRCQTNQGSATFHAWTSRLTRIRRMFAIKDEHFFV